MPVRKPIAGMLHRLNCASANDRKNTGSDSADAGAGTGAWALEYFAGMNAACRASTLCATRLPYSLASSTPRCGKLKTIESKAGGVATLRRRSC